MPDAGTAGFVTGFANSFDRGLNTGMSMADRKQRREREKTAEGRAEQDRVTSDRANEAINTFDSGDPTPVVEAWNQSASKQGLPPEKAATAAEIDAASGEVVIKHRDGTMTRKKSDQARAMLRSAYGVPARSAIPTEERADAEDSDYSFVMTSMATGNGEPLLNALNTQFKAKGGKPFKGIRQAEDGWMLVKDDGSEVPLPSADAESLAADLYQKRTSRRSAIATGDEKPTTTAAKPNALQKDIATQDASEFFSDWVDSTNLDPKDQEKMLSRFLEVMRDPNSKKGAIESMVEMGIPIKQYATIEPEMKDRLMKRMEERRQEARSPDSPGKEKITAEEAADIAAIPKDDAKRRARPANVRFAIDPNAAPGPAPAQQAQQQPAQGTTKTEQEFRDLVAGQGWSEAEIEESVAEYKRQGRIR